MTEPTGQIPLIKIAPFESEEWLEIKARAEAAGIAVEERQLASDATEANPRRVLGILSMPNNGSVRKIQVFRSAFPEFRTIKFEDFVFIGDYEAIWNRNTKPQSTA